jgi:hypothetical protein
LPGGKIGDVEEVLARYHHILADGPRPMLTKEGKALAQGVLSRKAGAAAVAGDPRIDHDTITGSDAGNIGAGVGNDSSPIGTENVWELERQAGKPAKGPKIEMVQRGGFEPNQHVTAVNDARSWNVGNVELREITVTASDQCFHPSG